MKMNVFRTRSENIGSRSQCEYQLGPNYMV